VVSRNKTVRAGDTTYRNCIQIRETTKEGNDLYWTFAPGVGFVQFGEGQGAFILEETGEGGTASDVASGSGSSNPGASGLDYFRDNPVLIALAANTFANEPFNTRTIEARFRQSVQAGVTYVYLSPKWDELEPRAGQYNWKDIEFQVRQAAQANLPVVCNVRMVDTGNRAMPRDLMSLSFRDDKVRKRLLALLDGLMPRLKDNVKLILIGNEVDAYFRGRPREVSEYARLLDAARRKIQEHQPGLPFSVSVTLEGVGELNSLLKPIFDRSDFMALTYYPLNPDFTFREPDVVRGDFSRILAAAGGKKILFQEIGYSTDRLNGSSEGKQARFFANVFRSLRQHEDTILGANFLFMSDLPDSVVDSLAQYYRLPNAERFKAFLRTLGMFDQRGRPKQGWQVFREEALRIKQGG
jgi:hypothetical protein